MAHVTYLVLLLILLFPAMAADRWFGLGVLAESRRLGGTILLMLAIFLTWDAVGRAAGIWWPDPAHTLGPGLVGGLVPLEELLFVGGTTYALLVLWRVAALAQSRRGARRAGAHPR